MQKVLTFKEFYVLEENIITDTLLKILKRITSLSQIKKVISYFKLDKEKILKFLAFLKITYIVLYTEVFENLKTPERLGRTALGERDAPALAVIIAWLVIEALMIPLSVGTVISVGDLLGRIKPAAIQQLESEVEEVVIENQSNIADATETANTSKSTAHTSVNTAKNKWSRYTNPDMFIAMVKAFEAGDYKTPFKQSTPLNAYPDRTQRSIGYGTKAREGETSLSQKEATKRLIDELNFNRRQVNDMLKQKGWKLNSIQINGLTDFAFNRGDGALRKMIIKAKNLRDLSKDILSTTYITTPDGRKIYNKAIADRREWEIALLNK